VEGMISERQGKCSWQAGKQNCRTVVHWGRYMAEDEWRSESPTVGH
jgi:hypothetical protein